MGKDYKEFDDTDFELINVLIRVFSTMLKINKNVVVFTKEQWLNIYESQSTKKEKLNVSTEMDYVFGQCDPEVGIIYLNPRLCRREFNVLVLTIVHELLHIRFPKKSEEYIQTMERRLTGRYDLPISEFKCGNR